MTRVERIESSKTAVSSETAFAIPAESPAVFPVADLAGAFTTRAGAGERFTTVTKFDLDSAAMTGGPVVPVWANAESVVDVYGLRPLVEKARSIVLEVFGLSASLALEVVRDPDSGTPSLLLRIQITETQSELRRDFSRRYARETMLPEDAPVPVILWDYDNAVSA